MTMALTMALPVFTSKVVLFSILRIVSPALVLLSTLLIIPARPSPPQSPSPITSVVVATRTPRRAVILALLSLLSLTYLFDGIVFIVFVVIHKSWPRLTGTEIGAVEGVIAFAGLAALGTWKDLHGVDVWNSKRLKFGLSGSLVLDIALVVLYSLTFRSEFSDICFWPVSLTIVSVSRSFVYQLVIVLSRSRIPSSPTCTPPIRHRQPTCCVPSYRINRRRGPNRFESPPSGFGKRRNFRWAFYS